MIPSLYFARIMLCNRKKGDIKLYFHASLWAEIAKTTADVYRETKKIYHYPLVKIIPILTFYFI